MIDKAIYLGFITKELRILKPGKNYLFSHLEVEQESDHPDYSLYIPKSWRTDQGTIQPPTLARETADSTDTKLMDGDGGEPSLERTDAKATTSPMKDVPQHPSWARKRHIFHGPTGPKR